MGIQPSGGFRPAQAGWGTVLECEPLARLAGHCFTLRDLDLGSSRDHAGRAWAQVAGFLGVAASRLGHLRQEHGVTVAHDPWPEKPGVQPAVPAGDIAVTGEPESAVAVQVADCVPVLLADRRTGAVGAVHAGWRGTAARAAAVAVHAMGRAFDSRPADLVAAVGPSIGPCCYEVGEDVLDAFRHGGHPAADVDRWFDATRGPRPFLDLWAATRDQLLEAGVAPDHVHVAGLCTASEGDRFFSFRREGATTGRMVAAIRRGPRTAPSDTCV
jgi:YfiH family protein